MTVTFDFTIVSRTDVPGISQVMPQNEEAYNYLVDEAHLHVLQDGSAVLFSDTVGDFISDSAWAHLSCNLV